jgi:hypothetical protein
MAPAAHGLRTAGPDAATGAPGSSPPAAPKLWPAGGAPSTGRHIAALRATAPCPAALVRHWADVPTWCAQAAGRQRPARALVPRRGRHHVPWARPPLPACDVPLDAVAHTGRACLSRVRWSAGTTCVSSGTRKGVYCAGSSALPVAPSVAHNHGGETQGRVAPWPYDMAAKRRVSWQRRPVIGYWRPLATLDHRGGHSQVHATHGTSVQ